MLKENILYKDGLSVNGYVADIKAWPVHFHDDMELHRMGRPIWF